MVLAEQAARLLTKPKVKADRQRNPEAKRVREELYIYDFDMESKEETTWRASLPLNVLLDNVPETCRYAYDNFKCRMIGAVLAAPLGAVLGISLMLLLFMYGFGVPWKLFLTLAIILGSLLGVGPAGFLGWMLGPRFGPKNFWTIRRLTFVTGHKESDEQRGKDLEEYVHWLQGNAHTPKQEPSSWRAVRALEFSFLEDSPASGDLEEEDAEPQKGPQSLQLFGNAISSRNGAQQSFRPIVYRASVLYEDLMQRIVKKRWGQKFPSGWHKLEIGAAIVLAVAVLAMLFFTIMVVPSLKENSQEASRGKPSASASQWSNFKYL